MTNGEWIKKEAKACWDDCDNDSFSVIKYARFSEEWWNAEHEESYTAEQAQKDYKLLMQYCGSGFTCGGKDCDFKSTTRNCAFGDIDLNHLKEWAKKRREELNQKKTKGEAFLELHPNASLKKINPCYVDERVNQYPTYGCEKCKYSETDYCASTYWNEPVEVE